MTQSVVAAFDAFTLAYTTEYASHNKSCIIIFYIISFRIDNAFLQQLDK